MALSVIVIGPAAAQIAISAIALLLGTRSFLFGQASDIGGCVAIVVAGRAELAFANMLDEGVLLPIRSAIIVAMLFARTIVIIGLCIVVQVEACTRLQLLLLQIFVLIRALIRISKIDLRIGSQRLRAVQQLFSL